MPACQQTYSSKRIARMLRDRATKYACKDEQELRQVRVMRGRPRLHCTTGAIGHFSQISVQTNLAQARALLFYFPV